MSNNGFLYVASNNRAYYRAARNSAQSLLDYYPDAHITIFTHEEWIEDGDDEIFTSIITDSVPRHMRAKLWALDKTPYDITMYLDCDTEIHHDDIQKVFDLIPDDIDILFTANRPYNAKLTKLSETEEMTEHCGVFLYRNNPETLRLMGSWWTEYCKQREPGYDNKHYPKDALQWDTFTMWRLLNLESFDVKTARFPHPDARWNFVVGYREEELDGQEMVVYHYTIPKALMEAQ